MIDFLLKTLLQDQYVFVERLGAFRIQLRHAVIEKNVIHPPYNEVVFSQNDSEENNFALANQISRDKKCLFTEANELIMKWVDELLAALQHNKSVTYEGFGTFMLDKKGNISFESMVVPQLNSQFEGMEPIDIKSVGVAVAEEDEAMKVVEPVVEAEPEPVVEPEPVAEPEEDEAMKGVEPVAEVEPEPVVESEPVVEPEPVTEPEEDEAMKIVEPVMEAEPESVVEPEPVAEPEEDEAMKDKEKDDDDDNEEEEDDDDDDDDDEKKHHKLAWLWILLLLLIALGALGFVFKDRIWNYYQQWKDKKHLVEQEVTSEATVEENQTATFEEEPAVEEVEPVEEEIPEVVEEPAPKSVAPTPVKSTSDGKYDYIRFEQGHYYVIVGSFPTETDVERHIRNKRLGQYSPKIVKQEGVKNLRVCIGVFDTEAAAEQFAKTTNQNYWILK